MEHYYRQIYSYELKDKDIMTNADIERNKQLRRIADSLEKIAKCLNKNTTNNIPLDSEKLYINYTNNDEK